MSPWLTACWSTVFIIVTNMRADRHVWWGKSSLSWICRWDASCQLWSEEP